jgi:hypothetical protein
MAKVIRWACPLWVWAILACVPLVGCSTSRFRVVDAATDAPLDCVLVEGYRFRPLQAIPSDFSWNELDLDPTDRNGSVSSTSAWSLMPGDNEYRFVFIKPGYRPAEALVYPDKTLLVSPADDAGWRPAEDDPRHMIGNVPARTFETVSGKGEMTIRLYRDENVKPASGDSNGGVPQ